MKMSLCSLLFQNSVHIYPKLKHQVDLTVVTSIAISAASSIASIISSIASVSIVWFRGGLSRSLSVVSIAPVSSIVTTVASIISSIASVISIVWVGFSISFWFCYSFSISRSLAIVSSIPLIAIAFVAFSISFVSAISTVWFRLS